MEYKPYIAFEDNYTSFFFFRIPFEVTNGVVSFQLLMGNKEYFALKLRLLGSIVVSQKAKKRDNLQKVTRGRKLHNLH